MIFPQELEQNWTFPLGEENRLKDRFISFGKICFNDEREQVK